MHLCSKYPNPLELMFEPNEFLNSNSMTWSDLPRIPVKRPTASKIASEVDIYRSGQASIVDIIEEFGGTSFIANVFYHNFTKHFINYFDATI